MTTNITEDHRHAFKALTSGAYSNFALDMRFYNKRGTAEQWIKEGKQAVKMTRLSCHRSRSNEVRLWLSVIAYNLGNLWRRLGLPRRIGNWSLTSLQQRLVKTGGRLVKHARYYWLLLAEGHLTQRLFANMLGRIDRLALPSPLTLKKRSQEPIRGVSGLELDPECLEIRSVTVDLDSNHRAPAHGPASCTGDLDSGSKS